MRLDAVANLAGDSRKWSTTTAQHQFVELAEVEAVTE
jgi:hypothetical protein